jgi:MFS family permease
VSVVERSPESRRALIRLAAGLILSMTTWFSASAVLPQLRALWDLSPNRASWLTIAVQLGFVLGALVSSAFNLADIVAPRRVILIGCFGAALANYLLLAAGPTTALWCRFATGFFLAGVYPPALKLMSSWFRTGRGLALGIMVGALTVGSAAPHLVNGLGGADWRAVVIVTSVLTLCGGLLVELTVADGPYPFPRATFDPRQIGLVFRSRGVRLASLGYFGHMWELYAMWAWFVAFFASVLVRRGSDPSPAASFATFAVIGIGGLGCVVGGALGDRWGRTRTTISMMAVSGACALAIGFAYRAPTWIVLSIGLVWGFTVVADSAQFSTMVTELADQAYVGTALTLQLALGFTLTVATIWLVPNIVSSRLGWEWAFAFLVPGPLLGIAAMHRLKRAPEAAAIAGGRG